MIQSTRWHNRHPFGFWARLQPWVARHPLWIIICVGALLRGIAAANSFGWFAPDDLGLAIEQGYRWLQNPNVPMDDVIRSPILSWLFWAMMRVAHAIGIVGRANVLRFCYGLLGLWSLLAIAATYRLARMRFSAGDARVAAWLTAAYALMPHVSTRGLIEVIAIVPLIWALVMFEAAQTGSLRQQFTCSLTGGLLLGAATLIRFQLGLVWFTVACLFVYRSRPYRSASRHGHSAASGGGAALTRLAGLAVGGLVTVALQVLMDLAMLRGPLATWRGYLHFNVHYSHTLGTSPWYTYLGEFALLALPPAGVWLAWPWLKASLQHPTVACVLGSFVAMHSLVGHKEDRFMFTVLPLFFIPLAKALRQAWQQGGRARWVAQSFWALNAVALVIASLSDAHRNVTVPLLQVAATPSPQVAAIGFTQPALPRYYLGEHTDVRHADSIAALRVLMQEQSWQPNYILLRHLPDAACIQDIAELSALHCGPVIAYAGDWVDRLLVAVNRHNQLRAPTGLVVCKPASV